MNMVQDKIKFVEAIPPANYSGAAGTGNYISLKNYRKCAIVINTGAWAGGTAAVTVNKATEVSGLGATAASFSYMYTNDGAATGSLLTKTAVTSNTFNLDTANSMYVIEIDAASLGDCDCIQLAVASPGANNDYYSATYVLSEPRFKDDYDTVEPLTD